MRVQVPKASAASASSVVHYERKPPPGRWFSGTVVAPDLDDLFTAHLGPEVPDEEALSAVYQFSAEPGPQGDFVDSPYAYHLVWFQRGTYWTGLDRRVLPRDLAAVATEYRTPAPGRVGEHLAVGFAPEGSLGAGFVFRSQLPFERTEYYTAKDAQWLHEFTTVDPQTGLIETFHSGPSVLRERAVGGGHRERWGQAVFGPAFPPVESDTQWLYRHGGALPTVAGAGIAQGTDAIVVGVPLYNDLSPEHSGGFSREDSGRTALYLDGELIGEVPTSLSGEFGVPDRAGTYRVEVEGRRDSYAELSTNVRGVWTFESATEPDAESVVLPVMAVRFGPQLDEHNSARAGRTFQLPVTVQRQFGAAEAEVVNLEIEVSYDDGETWAQVPVESAGSGWQAQLRHPPVAGYVSLRAAAADSAGGTVDVTIIRAYSLRVAD